jgi:hypothetical protein
VGGSLQAFYLAMTYGGGTKGALIGEFITFSRRLTAEGAAGKEEKRAGGFVTPRSCLCVRSPLTHVWKERKNEDR